MKYAVETRVYAGNRKRRREARASNRINIDNGSQRISAENRKRRKGRQLHGGIEEKLINRNAS